MTVHDHNANVQQSAAKEIEKLHLNPIIHPKQTNNGTTIIENIAGELQEFKIQSNTQKYRLIGVPFYNYEDGNKFKQSLYEVVGS